MTMEEQTVPHRACVLVVDDDEDIRETLREVVEMAGCSAILAANGAEALKMLEVHRPCLIILDLLMPIMTGDQLIDVMKNAPELSGLAILVSTSAPGRAPPGIPVLPKPIDIGVLWSWMRKTCTCGAPVAVG
jgi:two-component system chemotaxis response regulator CheY